MKQKRAAKAPKTAPRSDAPFCPIVGLGASAGGREAFQEVLENLPSNTGLAFVFVQHLDPKHDSMLVDLLAKSTSMPVLQATDNSPVKPNHVYIIPPNAGIQLSEGVLRLTPRTAGIHMPINEFFTSLAENQGTRAIAVLLSGTASDGTLGMKAVKAVGGITLAQDKSARYDAMPRNAATAGWVDMMLPPSQIAEEILRLCRHPYVTVNDVAEEPPDRMQAGRFTEIFSMLRMTTGVDFALYKHGTLQRRIFRRMALNKIETLDEYARFLKENRAEVKALFQDILISVTGFFREPVTFDALKRHVFPAIFNGRSTDDPVRVWVPGCSTGEEAYSVAISLLEFMGDAEVEVPVQIFGTDLSEPALERARSGVYPESIASEVSSDRLRRFFVKVDGQFQVSRSVRDRCIFAQQNLTKDPPFSKLDLITCRNLLIYLGPLIQAKVMRFFHYGLKPSGFLVLGLSETASGPAELFLPIDKRLKIYTRKAVVSHVDQLDFGVYEDIRMDSPTKRQGGHVTATEVQHRVDQFILSRYSPAGVLVDEHMNILQFQGHTAPYLEHSAGTPALNVVRMLRSELVVPFRKLFERVHKKQSTVKSDAINFSHEERIHNVRISITPMMLPGRGDSQFLVMFEEFPAMTEVKRPEPPAKKTRGGVNHRVQDLEEELSSTKQYLESVIEEQQATTEELKSANEEVQSSNEELQSTNEELLTAKEELQSTNEELTTVNEEMHSRNAELSQINNDLNNLLASVNIPIVMLGNDLRIRRFTPQAEKVLNLLPADVGRPVSDFKPKIDIPDLEHLFLDVIENLHVKEREVQDREGRWFSMWIRPYRTAENKIDGAVMVLVDITDRKLVAEARYRRLFEAAKDGIVLADGESGEIIDLNPYMAKTFSISRSGSVGVRYWELTIFQGTELNAQSLAEMHENESIKKSLRVKTKSGERFEIEIVGNLYQESEKRVLQLSIRDITERKRAEASENQDEWQNLEAVARLAGGLADDFNDLLTTILGHTKLIQHSLKPRDPAAKDAEQISRAVSRAERLTRQLLALGRPQTVQMEILNLNELLGELEPVMRSAAPPGVQLSIDLESGLKAVHADTAQMQQVILNLVFDARDSLPAGGTIRISTRNSSIDEAYAQEHPAVPPGRYVVLEISDTGSGMHNAGGEAGPNLSDRLFHADATKGPGRRLPVYGIIRQFGGHVWAVSELGRGTTCRIFLPEVDILSPAISDTPESDGLRTGSETILLVEDEEMVRGLTARILRQCGYTVIEAPGAAEAIRSAGDCGRKIDLLLTEIVLPDMNGHELAKSIGSSSPDTKVLFISGKAPGSLLTAAQKEVKFIQKPFMPDALSRRIREVLEG